MRVMIALAALIALTGCARIAEKQVHSELVAAGLPEPMAGCMAERMAEQLSLIQLRKLERLRPREGEAKVPVNIAGFLERARRVGDAEVIEVSAVAAAVCALASL